jgi:hydroxymethylglutaryl-CoA reductase (NADPH)
MALKIPIDPVALTEALPFLVCTVGFDKPLRLARAVFGHEHLLLPPGVEAPSKLNAPLAVPNFQPTSSHHQLKPAPKIITESLSRVYAPIIRDYILEIAVLTVGAYSKVGGLKEVCALAALILAVDCLLLCTYLAAILGVMVEVSNGFNSPLSFRLALRQSSFVGIYAVCSFFGFDGSSFFLFWALP